MKKTEAFFKFQNTDGSGKDEFVLPFCPAGIRFSVGYKRKKKGDLQERGGSVSKKSVEQQLFSGVTMSMHLIFDKSREGTSVKSDVERLMLELRESLSDRQSMFCWGTTIFQGVLEQVSANYVMFGPDGAALRAEMDVTVACREKEALKQFFQADYETIFKPKNSVKHREGKAVLTVKGNERDKEYQVQYNPGSIQCTRNREISLAGMESGRAADNPAQHTFAEDGSLSLELLFTGKETQTQVNGLLGMKVIDDQKPVALCWGEQYFLGWISSVQGEYTSFQNNGEPDSGKVSLTISGTEYEISI